MGTIVRTERFGELDLPEERIISFPQGLIGFSHLRRFAIVGDPRGGPFQWLQAVDAADLAFVVADPRNFFPGYAAPVKEEDLRSIGIESLDEATVVVILVVPREPRRITANLQSPILINLRDRLARQIVLDGSQYSTRHPIFSQEAVEVTSRSEEAPC